jgi:hypothetical protein
MLDGPASAAPLVRLEPTLARAGAAEPTVESMLMHALDKGLSAADLKEMLGMWRDVRAERAAQAFNVAMARFRAECPAITKSRDALKGNQVMYRYADLSEITKVIDPILHRLGLTYTWDADVQDDQTVMTCTVHHVDGHSRSARFACKGSGTSMMNAAQVAASATTFGRRYSLVFALGLTIDEDDDGRRAAPNPQPEHDPNAPRNGTRAEGYAERPPATPADPNLATKQQIAALRDEWTKRHKPADASFEAFAAWAKGKLRCEASMTHATHWTLDAYDAVKEGM